jgi:NADPH-dependent 2,4-dienoyl-CoA reductase/sulfur reductase-like enzyme
MAQRLVVIGGDGAGMSAAAQARRRRPDLEIVALERGRYTSYSACGIPFLVGGSVQSVEALVSRSPDAFRAMHIDARIGHEVVAVDLADRSVEVRNLVRERSFRLGFDLLHIATGASPVRPDVPGIDGDHVHGVQTLDDARALLADAQTLRPEHVVVVGSGYVGLELAESFLDRGATVTVVERAGEVMSSLDPDMGALVARAMRASGVNVRLGEELTAVEPGTVHVTGGELPADLVVLGTGVAPNSELARRAGIATGVRGTIAVDRRQRTSAEGVWAAGDCCESRHVVSGLPYYEALGTAANKQGRVAGINIAGGYATFPGVAGTAVTRICATEVGRTGLGELEAAEAGFVTVSSTVTATTVAAYLPEAGPLTFKLVAEAGSGRVLGAQIVGASGSAKRVDVVATALAAGLGVEDLVNLDLGYAPPFGSVWEPVQIAARDIAGSLR